MKPPGSGNHRGMRTLAAFAVALAAPAAVASPCEVHVAHAPDDVRTVVESWVGKETRCGAPLEVRIVPTYAVAANALGPYQTLLDLTGISWLVEQATGHRIALKWGLLNTYVGLILPLIATATGTFLYRQFFLTIPDELVEAAKMDGAGALRFFKDILVPLSRTNMAALGTIMFVWAWNQYLWPLLVTTDAAHGTAVMELKELIPGSFGIPDWNVAMAGTLIIMLPPLVVVILMQRWFVRGLIATEK